MLLKLSPKETRCSILIYFGSRLSNITFNVLDPVGAVVEEWELRGAMIQSANFGDLAFDSSDPVEIALTLRYDYAILKF